MSRTETNPKPLKVHLALNTGKLEESVAFYRAFFGSEPVKHKPGYAKFDIEDPPLNLTLNEAQVKELGALNHLGLQVDSSEAVTAAAARLAEAGLATQEERDTDCCHALQDKVWVQDPNGYGWEIFVVKVADTSPELSAARGSDGTVTAACCAPAELLPGSCCTPVEEAAGTCC